MSVYHRARICGLLAKHGDEGDVEVTEYAIRCISHAQDILRNEELSDCSNARQAMVDLIMDARETLMVRSPDIDIPKDIMEAIYTPDSDSSTDSERLFETSSDEEDEEEEEEEQDNAMDVDADRTSSPRSILDTVQLPPTHILTPGFSSSAPVPELVELAFDVEPQNIRALGLVLTLLVTDNRGMVDNIFAFARTRGFSEEEIQEIITKAYVPKRVQAEGGDLGGDFTLSELFLFLFLFLSLSLWACVF